MRELKIDLSEILDLVSCAQDYGFADDVLMCSLYDFTGDVSDEEIKDFSASFLTPEMRAQGYSEEDQEQTAERVTEWRDTYRAAADRRGEE